MDYKYSETFASVGLWHKNSTLCLEAEQAHVMCSLHGYVV